MGCKCFVSLVAKQMTSNTVVAMCDVMQMCFVGFSIQIELICCGRICSVIYLLQGCSAFSDDKFCDPKLKNASKNKQLSNFWPRARQNTFLHGSHACTHEFLDWALCVVQDFVDTFFC